MSAPGALQVRPATAVDLPAIGRLGALLVRAHHEFDPQRFIAPTAGTAAGYAHYLGTQLEAEDACVLVAELDGAVVGYSYGGLEPHDWMALRGPAGVIYDVVTDPDARRRGVATALMQEMMAELRRRGAPRIVLSTAHANTTAQALFERLGFRRTMVEMTRE